MPRTMWVENFDGHGFDSVARGGGDRDGAGARRPGKSASSAGVKNASKVAISWCPTWVPDVKLG